MATSTEDLINSVIDQLHGFTGDVESVTTLLQAIDTGDHSFEFDTAQTLGRGPAEIDDEVVYLSSVDNNGGTATIAPWGRGLQGTTPASHAYNAKITSSPRFPRGRVLSALNETVGRLSADLFAIDQYEFMPNPAVNNYPMPAGVTDILAAWQQTYGPTLIWRPLNHWQLDHQADTSAFPSGVSLQLWRRLEPGRKVKVSYAADLTPLTLGGMLADTGLAESTRDLVIVGAQSNLLRSQDFSRLQLGAVEQQARNVDVPITSATKIASYLEQVFQTRLIEEKQQLLRFFPDSAYRMR